MILAGLKPLGLLYSNPPFSMVLLSEVSVSCGQLWSKHTKWKIPEIINS
jgi:hypothetical protein